MKARLIAALTHHLQTPFVLAVLACLVAMLWISQGFSLGARLFPTAVASLGILLAVLELGRQVIRRGAKEESDFSDLSEGEETPAFYARGLLFFAWMASFIGLFFLIGALPAAGLYVLGFLRLQYRSPWLPSLALSVGLVALLWGLGVALQLRWPNPLLF
ncbi:tripartite tricarboxylate transporter TctB family protein [Halomonas sp.]|uniref:tripartite tricarboxylate transporter TctB family protein n=1 Tax=Halomonas sp. TaxID=1486246 RepID=UPI0025C601AA|nr:tripartite tricarboxylate transporter TctB family protein [Halomonas sp.]